MTLREKITQNKRFALRNGDNKMKLVLSTLLGEIERFTVDGKPVKEPTDAQVISIIKKMIANNKLTNTEEENKYIELYLPKMMDNEELNARIKHYIKDLGEETSIRDMKKVMSFLSENYPGQYDGKIAAVYVKNLLM